ncbi:MAG TPA: hypothetical protein VGX95_18645 [Xanthobacteraceae bacterium]|jgi:hypothetical protein|nr:hypothetical protein [Xanthobacteraceae bacterium]
MAPKSWRHRLTYAAMSAFLAWHTVAMVIAPAPDVSRAAQAVRVPFQQYLSLFRLDNRWSFFSPHIGLESEFRYIIEDKVGTRHLFRPTEGLNWFHPIFIWSWALSEAVILYPETYTDSTAAYLCRKHAALHPVAVTILEAEVRYFTPEDQLAGKHPLDPEFVTEHTLKRVECTGP